MYKGKLYRERFGRQYKKQTCFVSLEAVRKPPFSIYSFLVHGQQQVSSPILTENSELMPLPGQKILRIEDFTD